MTDTATVVTAQTRKHYVWGLAVAFGLGVLLAGQSRINGELGHRLGDGVPAALISFGSGGALLMVAYLLVRRVRAGVRTVWRTVLDRGRAPAGAGDRPALRWWQCIGGLSGAYLVAAQSATVTLIGVAVFTVALVAGQAASALLVDRYGFGPAGPQAITAPRVLGAALALAAVIVAVWERLGDPSSLVLALLPALAGVTGAFQQALNGRVAMAADNAAYGAVAAAVINFAVGTTALVVVFLIDLLIRGAPNALPSEPWLYVGGACGVAFITGAAVIVRVVGVFVLGLGTIAGQLAGSLLLDLTTPAADHPVTATVVAGTALAMVAVIVATVRR